VPTSVPTLRIGVVGGGLIAQLAHLPLLQRLPGFRIAALVDPSARVRSQLAARHGIAATFAQHDAMLDAGDIDAVLVCSPNETHAHVVLDALAAGLPVLVEKPLCLAPEDAELIVAGAAATGVVVQVGYMKRHDVAFERLAEHLPAREPLRVESTTVDCAIGERFRGPDLVIGDDVPADVIEAGRAALAEQAERATGEPVDGRRARVYSNAFAGALVHDVNLVLGVLDGARTGVRRIVDAAAHPDGSSASGVFELEDGARWCAAWLLEPAARRFEQRFAFHFEDGPRVLSLPAPYIDIDRTYRRQLLRFHASVTRGAPCVTPAEQGARDVDLLARLFRLALHEPVGAGR
jgi:hypothetical protein